MLRILDRHDQIFLNETFYLNDLRNMIRINKTIQEKIINFMV